MFNSKESVLRRPEDIPGRRGEDVLKTSLYGSVSKAKKHLSDEDLCIWS